MQSITAAPADCKSNSTSRQDGPRAIDGELARPLPLTQSADVPPGSGTLLARLKPFEDRCKLLADKVRAGQLPFIDAVDMAYSAATWSGIIDRYGDNAIQQVMASVFMGLNRVAA